MRENKQEEKRRKDEEKVTVRCQDTGKARRQKNYLTGTMRGSEREDGKGVKRKTGWDFM